MGEGSQRVVFVSGGASGIGRACVEAFAGANAVVYFSDLAAAAGEAVQAQLTAEGHDVRFRQADATEEAQVAALIQAIVAEHGRLDAAINNVGGVRSPDEPLRPLHECSLDGWNATLNLTLTSCFLAMKHELRPMLAAGAGSIVNVGSMAGIHISQNSSPAYHAAKAGVAHLTRKAATHYARSGVRINSVAPAATATEFVIRGWDEAQRNAMVDNIVPMGRMMRPEEIASVCAFLCSDAASGLTGHTIPVDGGWNAR
jgi:NAD(P)-dependent dehydrogenase (short-subunit alcohol dehydrogenase family)